MKNWFCFFAIAIVMGVLAGCGGGGSKAVTRDGQLKTVGIKAADLRTGINPFPKGPVGKAVHGTSFIAQLHHRSRTRTRDLEPDPDFPPLYSSSMFNADGSFTILYFTDPAGRISAGSLNAGALQDTANGQTVHFTFNLSAGPPPSNQYPLTVVGDYFFFSDNTSEIKAVVTDAIDGTVNYDCSYDANDVQTSCTQTAAVASGSGNSNISVAFVATNPSTGVSTYNVSDPTDGISGQLFVSADDSGTGHLMDLQAQTADLVWNTAGIGTITYRDNNNNVIGTDSLNLFGQ